MGRINKRLEELNITLPETPKPVGAYLLGVESGGFCYVSGQTGTRNGVLLHKGKVGKEVSLEDANKSARLAALNCLAEAKSVLGDLDRIERLVKVTGFVASASGFGEQPKVVNGASELMQEVFGEAGRHARSSIGVAELPFDAPVEIEAIFKIRS